MTYRETILLFLLLGLTGAAVLWPSETLDTGIPVSSHSVPVLAQTNPVAISAPESPPLGPAVFHPVEEWMLVPAVLTAYTDHDPDAPVGPDGKPLRQTAWKQRDTAVAHPYGIAADPQLIPYGSKVLVDEYMGVSYPDRAWEVDDTGGNMRLSNQHYFVVHLDLRYRTRTSALKQGKEWTDIRVNVAGWSEAQKDRLRRAAENGAKMRDAGKKP